MNCKSGILSSHVAAKKKTKRNAAGPPVRIAKKSGANSDCTGGTIVKLYWRSIAGDALAETDGTGSTTNAAYNEYVFFAGRRIAQRNGSGGIFYYFADQVGSTRTVTTGSGPGQTPGQLCYDADFTPYGQEISYTGRLQTTACPPSYKFTGYERDPETGLDYAFARYYSSPLGRFLSTDPLGGAIGDLQSHNAYSYVANYPLNAVDPSGMCSQIRDADGNFRCYETCPQCVTGGGIFGWNEFDLLFLAIEPTGITRNPDYWDEFNACWAGDCPGISPFLPVYGNLGLLSLLGGGSVSGNTSASGTTAPKQTQISPQAQSCVAQANQQVQNELQIFGAYSGIRLFGRIAIGAGFGALSVARWSKYGGPWGMAAGAAIGGTIGAVSVAWQDSRTIQNIQNSFMDKFQACMAMGPAPPAPAP